MIFPFWKMFENFILNALSIEFLREFEFISEKALAPKSGVQDGCFNEKTKGKKSRDTVPFNI
jgi:hypothetical protein